MVVMLSVPIFFSRIGFCGSTYFFCPYVDVCVDVPVRIPCSCLVRSVGSAFALSL